MSAGQIIASVRDLAVTYRRERDDVLALRGVGLELVGGRVTALVGESGSGKSTLGLALLGLLPHSANITAGEILFEGRAIRDEAQWRAIRGSGIAWQPQDALAALDPLMTIGEQVSEGPRYADGCSEAEARERAFDALRRAGFPEPEQVFTRFAHELSGGMRQRAAFACAIARRPRVLVADEPTSSLDATLGLRLIEHVRELARSGVAVLWITHDLAAASFWADQIAVLYAGRVVEMGPAREVCDAPLHPYTAALIAAARSHAPAPPATLRATSGCAYRARCTFARVSCATADPVLVEVRADRRVACPFHAETSTP